MRDLKHFEVLIEDSLKTVVDFVIMVLEVS